MSQMVRVERELVFAGPANEEANISGIPMPKKVIVDDHFTDSAIPGWSQQESYGGTIATSATIGGAVTLTLGGTDNDNAELYGPKIWSAAKNCGMEARFHVDIITTIGINIGFVDAYHNVNDQINFEITSGAATLVNGRATDGAAFVFDTDGSTAVWYCAAVDSDDEGTPVAATGTRAPVASTFAELRVQLNSDGDATFYYNGIAVGFLPVCLSFAVTDLLTPYVAVIARTGAARILTLDRLTVWQDE